MLFFLIYSICLYLNLVLYLWCIVCDDSVTSVLYTVKIVWISLHILFFFFFSLWFYWKSSESCTIMKFYYLDNNFLVAPSIALLSSLTFLMFNYEYDCQQVFIIPWRQNFFCNSIKTLFIILLSNLIYYIFGKGENCETCS